MLLRKRKKSDEIFTFETKLVKMLWGKAKIYSISSCSFDFRMQCGIHIVQLSCVRHAEHSVATTFKYMNDLAAKTLYHGPKICFIFQYMALLKRKTE